MINAIIHLDDETRKLSEQEWMDLEEFILHLAENAAKTSLSTEPTYLLRAEKTWRVSYIKTRVSNSLLEDIYGHIRSYLYMHALPITVSVMAADFNQSIIVSKDAIEPWTTYVTATRIS